MLIMDQRETVASSLEKLEWCRLPLHHILITEPAVIKNAKTFTIDYQTHGWGSLLRGTGSRWIPAETKALQRKKAGIIDSVSGVLLGNVVLQIRHKVKSKSWFVQRSAQVFSPQHVATVSWSTKINLSLGSISEEEFPDPSVSLCSVSRVFCSY